jgi:hypothetical protein
MPDTVLLGSGVPVTSECLGIFAQAGLIVVAAALGPDGACLALTGRETRIQRMILGPNLVPAVGEAPEVIAALDREWPPGVRALCRHQPLAVRLVLGTRRPVHPPSGGRWQPPGCSLSSESAASFPSCPAQFPTDQTAFELALERVLLGLLEPAIARLIQRLRQEARPVALDPGRLPIEDLAEHDRP